MNEIVSIKFALEIEKLCSWWQKVSQEDREA